MKKKDIILHLIRHKEISIKKILNLARNSLAYFLKNSAPKGYPSILMVEPTNICNLRCPMCALGSGTLKRKRGYMSFENYKKIIDECGGYLININLYFFGEPFLNKDIYRMIEYAKRKRIFSRISTNALTLDSKEKIRKLIHSGLDYIVVSFDGTSKETYEKYRVGGDFNKLINNLKILVNEKKRLKSRFPLLELQFLVMSHNQHEIAKMKRLTKKIGADYLRFKTVSIVEGANEIEIKERMKYLPEEKYSRYKIEKDAIKPKENIKKSCMRPWLTATIDWEGTVIICCFDTFNKYAFGNVLEKGFMPIWQSQKYVNFRKQIMKNKKSISLCRDCVGSLLDEENI